MRHKRQSEILDAGGTIHMETRTFDAGKGSTIGMRSKELAHDYRYFPEPDLQPIKVSESANEGGHPPHDASTARANSVRITRASLALVTTMPASSPTTRPQRCTTRPVIARTTNYKGAANWVMGDVRSWMNERGLTMEQFPISAERLAGLIQLIDSGTVSHSVASQKLFPLMLDDTTSSAENLHRNTTWCSARMWT
jgi:aspartyl-tRNA(Asn)/glutamyl-tRNA(Gln) amidotransferase subunit B